MATKPRPDRAELIARRPDLSSELEARRRYLASRRVRMGSYVAYQEHLKQGGTDVEMLPDGAQDAVTK